MWAQEMKNYLFHDDAHAVHTFKNSICIVSFLIWTATISYKS